jgi:hypothetical protein
MSGAVHVTHPVCHHGVVRDSLIVLCSSLNSAFSGSDYIRLSDRVINEK